MVDHGKSTKRKKHHDKDKYYKLAKEQGLRSRAAFKLSQINRQYPILDDAKVVLDLCAAPGGWTQIAARVCGPKTQIVAVDILPIRSLQHNSRNITTIVGDITTDKCKAEITRAIPKSNGANGGIDVVLHDGAPNIGGSYEKDAYEQIELAVHALRCATQHLKKHGVFVTKIYRSRDSASFQWVVQQLFKEVTAFKPKASRQQSAEIFYICQGYYKPDKIDPRLLDPRHIFELVEGDTTGANAATGNMAANSKFHVFHKSWDKANKRQRDGYNTEHLDFTMRHVEPLAKFVQAKSQIEAIQMLSVCTGFSFQCEVCSPDRKPDKEEIKTCRCQFFLHHPFTSPEIKECVVDLKVLNKGDFKGLVLWREKMVNALAAQKEDLKHSKKKTKAADGDDSDSSDDDDDKEKDASSTGKKSGEVDEDEDEIQKEIQDLRDRKQRERKKIKKKDRKLMAKKRRQAALGMDLNAIDVQEHDQFFSLATLKSTQDLQHISEVNLDQVTDEQAFGAESEDEEEDEAGGLKVPEKDERTGYSYRLDSELDSAYERYLGSTKNGLAKSGTKTAKRSKKLQREKLAQESHEDQELVLNSAAGMDKDTQVYAQMLQGPKDSDDDSGSSDEEDDGFDAAPMTPAEHARKKKVSAASSSESNPLLHEFPDDPTSVKTARWFSNPLFATIGQAAESATKTKKTTKSLKVVQDTPSSDEDDDEEPMAESDDDSDDKTNTKRQKSKKETDTETDEKLDADDVFALMPKTDKQIRHEKRVKAIARDERRQVRKAKRLGDTEGEFDLAPANDNDNGEEDDIAQMAGMSEEKKRKLIQARKLIKAGMGQAAADDGKDSKNGFEVVEADRPLPAVDDRKYDSENEGYDSDDYAKTMALGTMMLRQSKAKALVDASYNRFAWNDPGDLPEWFVDDENRHYRPQLPIPAALLAKMKEKMAALSVRPIAKVAEARARKNNRAKHKLAAAKKKASSVAGSMDMSDTMKLKQISKALRSDDSKKGKNYVVSKKGSKGVKGSVMVDKRQKSDKRSMDRAQKKRKSGKTGGLVGSKKRRHHN